MHIQKGVFITTRIEKSTQKGLKSHSTVEIICVMMDRSVRNNTSFSFKGLNFELFLFAAN